MKSFFWILLVLSVVSVFHELVGELHTMAHNHYEYLRDVLDTSKKQPDHLSPSLGLTPKELVACDEYTARAYTESVSDGYRLGHGYNELSVQCLALAAFLFLTGIFGLRAVKKTGVRNV